MFNTAQQTYNPTTDLLSSTTLASATNSAFMQNIGAGPSRSTNVAHSMHARLHSAVAKSLKSGTRNRKYLRTGVASRSFAQASSGSGQCPQGLFSARGAKTNELMVKKDLAVEEAKVAKA